MFFRILNSIMSSNFLSNRIFIGIIVAVIIFAGFAGFEVLHSPQTKNIPTPTGIPTFLNVTPSGSFIVNNTTYLPSSITVQGEATNNTGNASYVMLSAYLQIWAMANIGNLNITTPYVVSGNDLNPVLQAWIGPSGNGIGNTSPDFINVAIEWQHFLSVTNQVESEPSMSVAVTYMFSYNATSNVLIQYNGYFPFNPFSYFANMTNITISEHPDLRGSPRMFIPIDQQSGSPSYVPDGFPCQGTLYGWVLKEQNSTYNVRIPLLFDNDTSTTQIISTEVSLGAFDNYIHFSAMKGYENNGSYSYIMGTTGTWNPYNIFTPQLMTLYPSSVNGTRSFGYIYVVGNMTLYRYQFAYRDCGSTIWRYYNDYYTTVEVDSINVQNGRFVSGFQYDGYNGSSPYSNLSAQKTLGFFNYSTPLQEGPLLPSQELQWSEIMDNLGTSYQNLDGTINGLIDLGLAYIGAIVAIGVAADWWPSGGWADTAAAVLAIAGFSTAALSFFLGGVVTAKSGVVVYGAAIENVGTTSGQNGNSVLTNLYRFSTSISISGTNFNLPTMWVFNPEA